MCIDKYINILEDGIDLMRYVDFGDLAAVLKSSKLVVTAGNGGSSATASHIANDLTKCAGIPTICLTDSIPLLTAYSNDDSYEYALANYYRDLRLPESHVTLIVYSGSGNSSNIVRLVNRAIGYGHNVIAVTGYYDYDGCGPNKLDVICGGEGGTYSVCFHVNDMQVAEDLHMIFSHILFRYVVGE